MSLPIERIPEVPGMLAEAAAKAGLELKAVLALFHAGAIGVEPPHRLAAMALGMRAFGPFGAAPRVAALRHGKLTAIVDERGTLTYAELDEQVNRLTHAFLDSGLKAGDSVGILCRNHRYPLIVGFAASRAGLNSLWLNTAFSKRQATEVIEREGVDLMIHDVEFDAVVSEVSPRLGALRIDIHTGEPDDVLDWIASGSPKSPPAPVKPGRLIMLTSGTTGTPKGAPRPEPRSLIIPGSLLDRMPMKARETTVVAPPLYHGTGLLLALISVALGSRVVLRTKFTPEQFLADIETYRASAVCVVPVMLQRVLELGEDAIAARDTTELRVIFCAGSQLPAKVAQRAQSLFGDVIYNLYGSTEVSIASIATPADVHEAPTSVGRPSMGARVKILDDAGAEVATGQTGRIFVGTNAPFEGYTGGGHKEVIDGLMSSGDVGHFDADGRLYIDGRDDEMIVSGGENVFPREVEELLVTHPAIADAAVIGVDDDDFGQRLRAFCVVRSGQSVEATEVQAFVRDNLARFKVPRDVVFLDELPRNPTGKVLKRELVKHP